MRFPPCFILFVLSIGIVSRVSSEETAGTVPRWAGDVSVGGTYLDGNTDSLQIHGGAKAKRTVDNTTLLLALEGAYGKSNEIRDTEWIHGSSQYNYEFRDLLYAGLFNDFWHDEIADLRYRYRVNPLLGFYLFKNECSHFALESGPAYVFENQAGQTDSYLALRFAQRFEFCFNQTNKFWQSIEYTPETADFSNYLLVAEAGIQTRLTDRLSTKIYAQNRFDGEPTGNQTENDFGLYFALVYGIGNPTKFNNSEALDALKKQKGSAWRFAGTAGANFLRGNTKSAVYSAAINGLRRWDIHELGTGISGSYGETNQTTTAEKVANYGFYNVDITPRWYVGSRVDALRDQLAAIDYRITGGLHTGFRFIDCDQTKLRVEAGLGHTWEDQVRSDSYVSSRIGEYFEHQLIDSLRFIQSSEITSQLDDFDNYFWVNKAGFEADLFCNWAWSNTVTHTYDNTPSPGLDESDLSVISGLKWSF